MSNSNWCQGTLLIALLLHAPFAVGDDLAQQGAAFLKKYCQRCHGTDYSYPGLDVTNRATLLHPTDETEAPFVVLAGERVNLNMSGRYIRLPYHATEGHKTIGNWYTTLLNAHGNPISHYGDFDLEMSRKKLDQAGAIRQLMG